MQRIRDRIVAIGLEGHRRFGMHCRLLRNSQRS
jgi:hypothetical protein